MPPVTRASSSGTEGVAAALFGKTRPLLPCRPTGRCLLSLLPRLRPYGFPPRWGFSTFRWAEGSETDPEPVGMLEIPHVRARFCPAQGFSTLSIARKESLGAAPKGCWKGGKPVPLVRNPIDREEKSRPKAARKRKGHPLGALKTLTPSFRR